MTKLISIDLLNDEMAPLTITTERVAEFNAEKIALRSGDDSLFYATRYDGLGYSSVYWQVHPGRSKEDYCRRLISFYNDLKTGGFEDRGTRGLDLGIIFNKITETPLPLDYLDGEPPRLFQQPGWENFNLLRVDTPYAAFSMEDWSKGGWKPETGLIAVLSHQDISTLVARLISDTARHSVPVTELQPVLAERAYTFRNL
ncbi:hypothetical protein HYT55_02725 [Candidatus Woesearchaeota archaeon]|nr:hypothetical protein [Candidatus Woesearchaeota archaeon]